MVSRDGAMPAAEWYDDLDDRGVAKFMAAARTLETTFRSSRPPAGRWEKVKISKTGLHEFKVTKPGGTAPHLRALGIRERRVVWLANGFTKQKNQLERRDVELGDSIHRDWIEGRSS